MRVEWSSHAISEVNAIWRYIAEQNPAAADRVRDRFVAGLDKLADFPMMGRAGRIPNTREFVFSDIPYVAIYEINADADKAIIMRVLHTARLRASDT